MKIKTVYKEYTSRHADEHSYREDGIDSIEYNETENYVDVIWVNGYVRRIFNPDNITF